MFFGKAKPGYTLTKFYFLPDLNGPVDFDWFSANIFPHCNELPVEYSVNYGKDRKIALLKSGVKITYCDLEAFDCSGASGEIVFSLGRAGSAFCDQNDCAVFECFVVSNDPLLSDAGIKILEAAQSQLALQYGYVRSLPASFSPVSEKKIKSGFFGQSITVEPVERRWMLDPNELEEGAIKGIYPINYWQTSVRTKLETIGFRLPPPTQMDGIVRCTDEDLKDILKQNPTYQQFIHICP